MVNTEVFIWGFKSKKSMIFFLLILHFLNLPAHENVDKVRSDFSSHNNGQLPEIQDNNPNHKDKLNPYQAVVTEDPYMKFDRLTKKNGLSSNYILDIFQDKFGFMWIATIKGLNRYDGHHFKQYFHAINDTVSIADDLVTCLDEDQEGNLWIGTRNGLNKYNRLNDYFETVITINEQGDTTEINDYIRAILPDENNILWIETASGDLIKYNYIQES